MIDHVHMCLSVSPKYSVSNVVGDIKRKSAISIALHFGSRHRNFTGEIFWARDYFVSAVGLDTDTFKDHEQRPLSRLGIDRVWQGIFNRQARENQQTEYGITLVWREDKGRVTVHRHWHYENGALEPCLSIRVSVIRG